MRARVAIAEASRPAHRGKLDLRAPNSEPGFAIGLDELVVSFWAKRECDGPCPPAPPPAPASASVAAGGRTPSIYVEALDVDGDYAWVGYWERYAPGPRWTRYEAVMPMGAKRAGHRVALGLVVGEVAGKMLIDDLAVRQRCTIPTAEAMVKPRTALHTGFEDCFSGSVVVDDFGGGEMTAEVPSSLAAKSGQLGALIHVTKPFTPSYNAKLRLGRFRLAKESRALSVKFAARSPSEPAPSVKVDVLDASDDNAWIGFGSAFNLTKEWQTFTAKVAVPRSRWGHLADVSLLVGGAAGIYHFDDIVVADPHVDPDAKEDGAPEAHAVVLAHDFEAASTALSSLALTAPLHDGINGKTHPLLAPHAAHGGGQGAELTIGSAGGVRLSLGRLVAAAGTLRVSFWARSPQRPMPTVTVDVLDASDGWAWLGSWEPMKMTEEWHHFAQTVAIDAAREGHFIELALVPTVSTLKANDVAQIHLDDVEVRAPAAARVLRTNVNCTDLGEETRANLGTLGGAKLATGAVGHRRAGVRGLLRPRPPRLRALVLLHARQRPRRVRAHGRGRVQGGRARLLPRAGPARDGGAGAREVATIYGHSTSSFPLSSSVHDGFNGLSVSTFTFTPPLGSWSRAAHRCEGAKGGGPRSAHPPNMLPGQRGHDGQPRYAIPRVPGAPPPPGAAASCCSSRSPRGGGPREGEVGLAPGRAAAPAAGEVELDLQGAAHVGPAVRHLQPEDADALQLVREVPSSVGAERST